MCTHTCTHTYTHEHTHTHTHIHIHTHTHTASIPLKISYEYAITTHTHTCSSAGTLYTFEREPIRFNSPSSVHFVLLACVQVALCVCVAAQRSRTTVGASERTTRGCPLIDKKSNKFSILSSFFVFYTTKM